MNEGEGVFDGLQLLRRALVEDDNSEKEEGEAANVEKVRVRHHNIFSET